MEELDPSNGQPNYECQESGLPKYVYNPSRSQIRIISHPPLHNSILIVMAGPGSGKTFTLAERIAYMIKHHHVKPEEILVLSMTNRAVNSIRSSLERSLGEQSGDLDVSTFHLFAAKLIDSQGAKYIPGFVNRVLVDDSSWRYASSIFLGKHFNINGASIGGTLTYKEFDRLISSIRSGTITREMAAKKFGVSEPYVESLILYLDSSGIIRYPDLVNNAVKILYNSMEKGEYIDQIENYKVVVVDEFQDMYENLLDMVEAITKYPTKSFEVDTSKHLFIAGDPNQSIYEFLGSNPDSMKNLESDFTLSTVDIHHEMIEESFRCPPTILKASVDICLPPGDEFAERIHSATKEFHMPIIKQFKSPIEEYHFVIKEIIRLTCELGGLLKLSDCAILARSNKEVDDINRILADNYGLNYNKLNSSIPWIKSKVHILLGILNVLERSSGSELFLMCVLMFLDTEYGSKLRISKVFSASREWAKRENVPGPVIEDYLVANMSGQLPKEFSIDKIYKSVKHQTIVNNFNKFLNVLYEERDTLMLDFENQTPVMLLSSLSNIVEKLGLKTFLNRSPTLKRGMTESEIEAANSKYTDELASDLRAFQTSLEGCFSRYRQRNVLNETGESFIKYFIRNYNEEYTLDAQNLVNTSTIHAAKGLEFPVVFIIGSSAYGRGPWEPVFKSQTSSSRLLYVAMTRSQCLLYQGCVGPIKDLPNVVHDLYDSKLPQIDQSSMLKLALILKRPMPSKDKITQGRVLLEDFKRLNQTRLIHTMRRNVLKNAYKPLLKISLIVKHI